MNNKPYQFAFHDRVSKIAPLDADFELVSSGVKLSRADKDRIFHKVRGNGNADSDYKCAGWIYPFSNFMTLYLVHYKYSENWVAVKAFDKTCIRNSYHTSGGIIQIAEIK